MDVSGLFAIHVSPLELTLRGTLICGCLLLILRFALRRDPDSFELPLATGVPAARGPAAALFKAKRLPGRNRHNEFLTPEDIAAVRAACLAVDGKLSVLRHDGSEPVCKDKDEGPPGA